MYCHSYKLKYTLFSIVASNRQARRESITDSSYLPQATSTTYSLLPIPVASDEKKAIASKIKPDPSLVKVRQLWIYMYTFMYILYVYMVIHVHAL